MKFKPTNNRILVKPDEKETKTESGIILADATVEKPTTGVVLVGNKLAKEGQKVLFSKFGYDEVVIEKELLYVISEINILGIFESNGK